MTKNYSKLVGCGVKLSTVIGTVRIDLTKSDRNSNKKTDCRSGTLEGSKQRLNMVDH